MASNDFINECKNNAYKNRLGTISIKNKKTKRGSIVSTDEAIQGPLDNYKIYGNTVQKKLPDEYTQVDYIKSSGNQYIDTGVNADSNLSIKMNLSSDYHIQQRRMGAIKNDNGVYTRHHITLNDSTTTNYIASFTGRTNSAQNLLSTIDDNKHYLNLDIYNKKVSVDEETPIDLTLQPFDTELNYWLFARNSNNSTNMSFAIMQIYDCKMYYSDVLVRDFIPCYRNSDNEVGLYDLVNNVFYTNQGTGSFTYGNMAPTPDAPIEMVSCGDKTKNLFDKNNANIINGYIQGNTGKIILGNSDLLAYIKCKPNTQYSFQRMQIRDNKGRLRIGTTQTIPIADMAVENFYYKGNSEYSTNKLDGYTTGANAEYLLFYFSQISGMSQNEIDTILSSIQIEENSIATPYEPYGYKIPINVNNSITNIYLDEPLRKIGEYSDYIDFANGKVVRNIDEIALDGTENWNGVQDYQSGTTKASKNGTFSVIRRMNKINNLISNKFNVQKNDNISDNTTAQSNLKNAHFCIRKNNPDRIYFKWENWQGKTGNEVKEIVALEPITINYTLATPTIEDIGLPNINLIEGKNIITIGTELESIIEVEYTNWENKIKNSDRLQKVTIDNGCIVNNEIIGSVYSKKVTSDILDINELDLENKKIDVKIGVKYDNESHENLNMGKYTIERPKDEQTANIGQIIAYDDLNSKLEDKYICGIDYQQGNKTLKDLYIDLCSQLGLTPKNLEFDNNTIPIANNPFTNGEKNRLVLQTIEKVSGTFSDIDNNTNEIDLCWLSNSVEPDYTFYRNDYTNLEGGKIVYGPINCLVIKNSQIDDENVTIKDDESIALNGEHTLTINEDYILYNSELRQLAINAIWNKVHNLTYVDCKLTTLYGKPFLKLGDKIRVYKTDTEYFDTYVLLHQFTYDGSFESIIQSPALTEQEIKTKQKKSLGEALKNTEVEVNKQKQTITALVQETSENTEKTSQLQLQSDEINQRIEDSQYYIDENGNKKTISGSINELKSTAEELNLNLQKIGGLNLMKNSSGQNGTIGYKSKMLKPYVEFQTWAEFDNYISLGSKVYQIYTCFIHVVGETADSERDCWYGLYYTEGFSKSYYFEQVVRNGNFIYPDKYNKYMDILYDNLFMFVEQNYTNSSSFKTFLEKYTDEYTNITPNIFTSISNDIIENNTISKSAFLLIPTVRDMYTTMNEDRIYGESFTMPKNTNKLYFSVKSKIDGLCGRARLIMYQLNDKMENIQNNLNVYDSYENHIVNDNFINIPDNILNNDNFIEYKVEMEISDRCVEILPCFSIGNNFVNDGPYVNFVNPILNPITRFYWKKVWETIDEVSAYYTYRSTHIKKKLQFFESTTLPEISDTPDFTQLWLCTDEIEGYTKDTLYTPQYEIDSNGEIISKTWAQTNYTKEQIERGIEIIMFDNWTYVYSAGAVESATPRPDMKFIIADCMVSATDTSWQPASGENYWGKNIKISGDKGIYIYNTVDGYNRIIDEKQDIAKDKNGNTTWELTGKGMKTKRAECESIRLPKLEILCTNDSTAFYYKENEDDDYGA